MSPCTNVTEWNSEFVQTSRNVMIIVYGQSRDRTGDVQHCTCTDTTLQATEPSGHSVEASTKRVTMFIGYVGNF